ncbi:MAG TPA: hypothetical protein VN253_05400 [Kofleriaceae bacterium]|nr:hypothetical protein [Kofleriaceae bacterium]
MKKMFIVMIVVAMAVGAACGGKKKAEPAAPKAGSGEMAPAAGSGEAGSAAGSGEAPPPAM